MSALLIVGAGGFGREVLQWLADAGLRDRVLGFLDDNPAALLRYPGIDSRVVGSIADYRPGPDEELVCGIGLPKVKKCCVEGLMARGGRFRTLVHPTAVVGARVAFGEGCVVCPGAVLTTDIQIGRFVTINCQSTIGHDAVVGDWTTLSGHCDVTGFVRLGEMVFMGSHASVIPGIVVPDGTVIGAGSVLMRSVKETRTHVGVPAREIC